MARGDGESFGALLRRHRQNAALTQEELSALTSLSVRAISSMEAGRTARPYRRSVSLLADALNLTQDSRVALHRASRDQRETDEQPAHQQPAHQESGHQAVVRPAQLPPDLAEFTGRAEQADWLTDFLSATGDERPVRVAAITGAGGVGKSALAVHVAHRLSAEFPDGQVFVELQGSTEQTALSSSEALARLLRGFGMVDASIPADVAERAAEYRSRMAGRQMLIVLDDARDAAHVRQLLPGTATSAVLVTSRGWLADLEGGRVLELGALAPADALALFASICGPDRIAAEPEATRTVLGACGGLPLAIRIAGARLVSRPAWDIGVLASRLANERHRLEELQVGDLAVRATFQVSYATLTASSGKAGKAGKAGRSADAGRAFRLLGLWPGSDISLPAASALLGVDVAQASRVLERLVDIHMLEEPAAQRYRFHDLIRVFAAERAAQDEPAVSREESVRRILPWYLHTADRALTVLELTPRVDLDLIAVEPGVQPLTFGGYDSAADWCDSERTNLVSAVTLASSLGLHEICAQLADVVWRSTMRSPWNGWLDVLDLGIASAAAMGDAQQQAWLHNYLGIALMFRGRNSEAVTHLDKALPLSREAGSPQCEATVTANLAIAYRELKQYDEALVYIERSAALNANSNRFGRILVNLGVIYVEVGRLDEGLLRMQEGLALIAEGGDYGGASIGRSMLSDAYRRLGRYNDAINSAEQALEISRRTRDEYQESAALHALGQALTESGELRRGRACLVSALELAERLRVPEVKVIAEAIAAIQDRARLSASLPPTLPVRLHGPWCSARPSWMCRGIPKGSGNSRPSPVLVKAGAWCDAPFVFLFQRRPARWSHHEATERAIGTCGSVVRA